jgi:hypothetical protein
LSDNRTNPVHRVAPALDGIRDHALSETLPIQGKSGDTLSTRG